VKGERRATSEGDVAVVGREEGAIVDEYKEREDIGQEISCEP
jgi:hypothetical protein